MALAAAGVLSLSSCNGFLDTKPNDIMTQDQVYADPALVKSVLANFYGRITFGQRNEAVEDYLCWMRLFIMITIVMRILIEINGALMTIH